MSKEFEELYIHDQMIIKDAIKQMDKAVRKILFVVDEHRCLKGTITGGDLRRWILANGDLTQAVDKIYNRAPIIAEQGGALLDMKAKMLENRIEYLPVVDPQRRIVDVLYWGDIFGAGVRRNHAKSDLDIPVVIMAGGKGMRMDPFTKILPKPLLPIGDKPVIEVIIDEFRKQGLKKFSLMLNYKGEMIESYFHHVEKDYELNYIKEDSFRGTAGGLKLLSSDIGGTFLVSNCDVIVRADFSEVVHFHKEHGGYLTVLSSIQHHKIPYGVINFKSGGQVVDMVEKPEYTFTINTGVYVIDQRALEFIPPAGVFDMNDLVNALLAKGKTVLTYPVNESDYMDVGQWEEYKKSLAKLQLGL